MRSRHVQVAVSLDRVRAAAELVCRNTNRRLIAVIKADAYGLGAPAVADVLASVVDELAYFNVHEAREVGKPGLVLGPPEGNPAEYRELKLRPTITNRRDAERFADLPVAINVDSGMQRFGCRVDDLGELARRCRVQDLFTHANNASSATAFAAACRNFPYPLHAASTSLLNTPETWLDAVRPGLALYRGAMRVSTPLQCVRATRGPIGYTGFEAPLVGIIQVGYSHGLRDAPVVINGRRQRLLEVGMNTSYVSVHAADSTGDDVVLLGDGLTETELAAHPGTRPHEVLCRYGAMGIRSYVRSADADRLGLKPDDPCTTRSSAADLPQT